MSPDVRVDLLLGLVALGAAAVNGGLGYGFSSITLPVALIVNRRGLARMLPRVWPLLLGAVPGTAVGALVLTETAPGKLKLFTFAALLPPLVAFSLAHSLLAAGLVPPKVAWSGLAAVVLLQGALLIQRARASTLVHGGLAR